MKDISKTNQIERFFGIIDNLIDGGVVDIIKEVRSDVALRRRAQRLFPSDGDKSSTTLALEAYGFSFDECLPSKDELRSCWSISDSYEVIIDTEKVDELSALSNLSPPELIGHLREVREEVVKEAVSYFVSDTSPELISYKTLREFPHIRSYVVQYFGGITNFREELNLDGRLVFYNNNSKVSTYARLGAEFEELLEGRVFSPEVSQIQHKDCRPDFIVDGSWIDAKLSRSTALDSRSDTISKYLRHTDKLTIIYAFDDGADTSAVEEEFNVEFKHISEFYEDLSAEAIDEFETFIKRVSTIKVASI